MAPLHSDQPKIEFAFPRACIDRPRGVCRAHGGERMTDRSNALVAVALAAMLTSGFIVMFIGAPIGTAEGQTAEFEGGITLDGDPAADGQTYEYDLNGTDGTSDVDVEFEGVKNTADRSRSTTAESDTLDVDPRGTSDPEDATMRLTGQRTEETQSQSGTLDNSDLDDFDIGGNNAPENAEITLDPNYNEISRTEHGSVDGSTTESVSPGDLGATDATVTVEGTSPGSVTSSVETIDTDSQILGGAGGTAERIEIDVEHGTLEEFTLHYERDDPYLDATTEEYDVYVGGEFHTSFDVAGEGDGIYERTFTGPWEVNSYDVIAVETGTLEGDSFRDGIRFNLDDNLYEDVDDPELEYPDPFPMDVGSQTLYSDGSTSISIGTDSSVPISGGPADYTIDYTARDGIEDLHVDVGEDTISENGIVTSEITESVDLNTGSESIESDYSGSSNRLDYDLSWTEVTTPQNPSIDLDDGSETISHAGELSDGETIEEPIDLSTGEHSADVSSDGPVQAEVVWTDVSRPVDPSVTVNGETVQHSGTLAEGQTVSETVSSSTLEAGGNTVEVAAGDANGGPTALVGFSYAHDAEATEKEVAVSAETWQERFDGEQTYSSDQVDTTARMTFSENIVDVRDLAVTVNGEAYDVPESEWEWDPDTPAVEVPVGDRSEGDEVVVSVVGSKVGVQNGEIAVTNPTTEGSEMETRANVYPDGEGTYGIDVSGTVWEDRLHDVDDVGWQDDESYSEVRSDGRQIVKLPNAVDGDHVEMGISDMRIEPTGGTVHAEPVGGVGSEGDEDFAHDRVDLSFEGATAVDVVYHNTTSGDVYGLERTSDGAIVDREQASSPVTLTADGSGTYAIVPSSFDSAVAVGAPQEQSSGLPGPTWLWLLLAVGGVSLLLIDVVAPGGRITGGSTVAAITAGGRRIINLIPRVNVGDGGSQTREPRGSSADGPNRATLLIATIGMASVGLVAAELVTARSIFFELPQLLGSQAAGGLAGAIGGVVGTSFGPVLVGTVALLGLWTFDQLTDAPLDRWVQVVAVSGVVIYMVESIRPGTLLGPVSSAVETMLPVLMLVALFVGWRWWRSRSQPDIVVEGAD